MAGEFFMPQAAPANRPSQGIAQPLVTAARAQAEAYARVGARIGDAVQENRDRRAVAEKFQELATLISSEDGYIPQEYRLADFSSPVAGAISRGTQAGFDGDALQSFVVQEVSKELDYLSEAEAGQLVGDMMQTRPYFVATPELMGQISRLEGELRALGVNEGAVQSVFARFGQDKAFSVQDLEAGLRKDADDRLGSAQFLSARAQAFGQASGAAAARTGPAAAEAREFERKQAALDAQSSLETQNALRDSAAGLIARANEQAEEFDSILNRARAEQEVTLERSAELAAARERAKQLITESTTSISSVFREGTVPDEFRDLRTLAESYPGSPEAARAIELMSQTDLGLARQKRAVLTDPTSVRRKLEEEFGITTEQADAVLATQLRESGTLTLTEFEETQRLQLRQQFENLERAALQRQVRGGGADDLSLLLGAGALDQAAGKLETATGSLDSILRIQSDEQKELLAEFNEGREDVLGNHALGGLRFRTDVGPEGVELVQTAGDDRLQEFLNFLEGRPELDRQANLFAGNVISSGFGRNLSPADQQEMLGQLAIRAQAAQGVRVPEVDGTTADKAADVFINTDPNDIR